MAHDHETDLVPVRRALLSVSDKTGLLDFARALATEFKVELISTGGTAKFLRDAGLIVTDVSDVTGFPEMMDGRVKTLHPKIHGGLLALRDHADHVASMKQHGIAPIDLVCINLYPFAQTIAKPDVSFEEAIENIDIGGPSMIRSAAKNHRWVLVCTSPDRYEKVLGDLRQHGGASCGKHRLKMAQRAFAHTAEYDATIADYLAQQVEGPGGGSLTGSGTARHVQQPTSGAVAQALVDQPELPSRIKASLAIAPNREAFLRGLLFEIAGAIGATEAAAFLIPEPAGEARMLPLVHIRNDASDDATRRTALIAFAELAQPCVQHRKNGVIEIEESVKPAKAPKQFCLIHLLYSGSAVAGCVTLIVDVANVSEAHSRLESINRLTEQVPASLFVKWLGERPLAEELELRLTKRLPLRYGENPHQHAALYVGDKPKEPSVAFAKQHHGKELSYINLLDADAALSCVKEFHAPAACIVKHATPCGVAMADSIGEAFERAYACDPLAAFGGIVAINKPIDRAAAEAITSIDKMLEVIVAPHYADDALELLRSRWKNVRLLEVGPISQGSDEERPATRRDRTELHLHKIVGGYLVQERDLAGIEAGEWKVSTSREPTAREMLDLRFAWLACKHVKSNAIVLAKDRATTGIGGGAVDRVGAARIAIEKAGDRAHGSVVASDAFFPFPDGPKLLIEAGVTAIVQPGGSVRDADSIAAADEAGVAMILTGRRHFRH